MFTIKTKFTLANYLIRNFFCVFALLICLAVQFVNGQTPDITALELGKSIERGISGGEKHVYIVDLIEGQFTGISILEDGIALRSAVSSPEGKQVLEIGSSNRKGEPRTVKFIAETSGKYNLKIEPSSKVAETGKYKIELKEIRSATETDIEAVNIVNMSLEVQKLRNAQKYDKAIVLAEKTLALIKKVRSKENADNTESAFIYNELGIIYDDKGDFKKSEEFHLRALQLNEKILGPDDSYIATNLLNLASLYTTTADFEKAEALYERALIIYEDNFGKESIKTSEALNSLAFFYFKSGNYSESEKTHLKALYIKEKNLGADAPAVAFSVNNLALVYHIKGDFPKAQTYLQRALFIFEKHLPKEHPNIAILLSNIAAIAAERGDYKQSEELFKRALAINEKVYGKDHFQVASTANGLASLYDRMKDYEKAISLFQRALKIREDTFGAEHSNVASSSESLATVYRNKGEYAKAEPLYKRALEIEEKNLGGESYRVAIMLTNLGGLYIKTKEYETAEPLLLRAVGIFEKVNGAEHPLTAKPIRSLALLKAAEKDFAESLDLQERFLAIRERNLELNLFVGSERQKLAYTKSLAEDMVSTISMHTQIAPKSTKAKEMALQLILTRKGRTLDAMAESISALRRNNLEKDQDLIDKLSNVRTQFANLTLRGIRKDEPAKYQQKLKDLNDKKEKLEDELSKQSAAYSVQRLPVTIETVRRQIPVNAALIEYIVYKPQDFKSFSTESSPAAPKYIAYILRQNGEINWAEIGDAKDIDKAIIAYRRALDDSKRKDVKELGRAVDEKIMKPIRDLLGNSTQLLISPDGQMNLIPFEALVDEKGKFLVETYSVNYLSSGRDLLRMQVARESKTKPVLVANPSFGNSSSDENKTTKNAKRHSITVTRDLSDTYFAPLDGTKQEGEAIKTLFPQANFLTQGKATETAIKQVTSPSILHIATHGFFLEDVENGVKNPLLRSGLAFAGANQRKSGEDDGILTALEASGLNLWGTKLVVLSACDTGLGEIKNGEGVYGLRRAFTLAGTESLVMSLWSVSDFVTRELMTEYYKNLKSGMGRNEALREVQLKMIKKKNRQHPFYWASFIQSGEWRNLEGKR